MTGRLGHARVWRWLRGRRAAWRARKSSRPHSWLVRRFLPMWAKETILAENERLRAQLAESRAQCERLRAYADGLEQGLRAVRGLRVCVETTQEGDRNNADPHDTGADG